MMLTDCERVDEETGTPPPQVYVLANQFSERVHMEIENMEVDALKAI